jgi:GT2 family glycosyltransferase
MIELASGWSIDRDDDGPLLCAPRGAFRLDAETHETIAGDGDELRASWVFERILNTLLSRVGAIAGATPWEPARPEAQADGPLVSVVVPTFEARDLLSGCVESLGQQTYRRVEVIVVDGGSTDGTLERVRALDSVKLVEVAENPGFAHAINRGAEAARGDLLLFLNNDATLEADAVAQLVHVAGQHPTRLAAVTAMVRRGDIRSVVESIGNVLGFHGFGSGVFAGYVDCGQFDRSRELFSAPYTAVLVPRDAWQTVGPLDERYRFYYEDIDWSMRARMAGMRIWAAPHALVYHEGSASTLARPSGFKEVMVRRNRLLWALKVLRMRNAVGFTRRYVIEDVQDLLGAAFSGDVAGLTVVPRAWAGAAAELPSIWRARQELATWHVVPDRNLFRAAGVAGQFMDGPYPRLDGDVIRGHYLHVRALARRACAQAP